MDTNKDSLPGPAESAFIKKQQKMSDHRERAHRERTMQKLATLSFREIEDIVLPDVENSLIAYRTSSFRKWVFVRVMLSLFGVAPAAYIVITGWVQGSPTPEMPTLLRIIHEQSWLWNTVNISASILFVVLAIIYAITFIVIKHIVANAGQDQRHQSTSLTGALDIVIRGKIAERVAKRHHWIVRRILDALFYGSVITAPLSPILFILAASQIAAYIAVKKIIGLYKDPDVAPKLERYMREKAVNILNEAEEWAEQERAFLDEGESHDEILHEALKTAGVIDMIQEEDWLEYAERLEKLRRETGGEPTVPARMALWVDLIKKGGNRIKQEMGQTQGQTRPHVVGAEGAGSVEPKP